MSRQNQSKHAKVRGNPSKAQFPAGLAEIVSETVRLWRKHHLGYDQTKYVVEQGRRRLKLQPVGTHRRTVNRLDKSEVERLIRNAYQSHSKCSARLSLVGSGRAQPDHAADILRSAADDEDGIEKLPVIPGPVIPASEQLGQLFLEQGDLASASKAFETALVNAPNVGEHDV
jgi:hypothetical protein